MSDMRKMGLRERKARMLRQQIFDAAVRLFAQAGYENITVYQIAADVGVSDRTINRIFGTKEEILFTEGADLRDLLCTGIRTSQSSNPLGAALDAFNALDAAFVDRRDDLILWQQLVDSSPALSGRILTKYLDWENAIGTILADRFELPPAASRMIAGAAIVCWRSAFSEWLTGSPHRLLPDAITSAAAALREGLQSSGF